jgi:hypothetical protein
MPGLAVFYFARGEEADGDIAVETATSSPEELATLTRADADKWGKIIKQRGISPL